MKRRLRQFCYFFLISIFVATVIYIFRNTTGITRIQQLLFPKPVTHVFTIKGIGVVGDSQSDEYQADDARGYEYAPTTLNWIEQLVKSRHMNFGTWQSFGDVRRSGFAYNWSRTGATSESLVPNQQAEGLASQISAGDVNVAIVYIGANDFAPYNTTDGYYAIYSGAITGEILTEKIDRVVTNIEQVVMTLKQSGAVRVFLVTVPDWNVSIQMQVGFYDQAKRDRVSQAIRIVNNRLVAFAREQAVPMIDVNAFYREQMAHAPLGSLLLDGEIVTLLVPGDEPHHAFLSDAIHPGTVVNGLFANYVLQRLNQELGTTIPYLSMSEIRSNAGL